MRPIDLARLGPAEGARIAVVGGCGGIGSVLVRAGLATGLQVATLDLPASLRQRPAFDGEWQLPCDAARADDLAQAFAALDARWGGLDGLVHLAGFTPPPKPLRETDEAAWDEVMQVNLRGAWLSAKAALPLLDRGRDAAIVLTSSGLSVTADKGVGPYAAAKAGINAITRNLARENAPAIRVNAVAPGPIDTDLVLNLSPEWRRAKLGELPLGRFGTPEDVAETVAFLASPAAALYAGQTLGPNSGDVML